MNSCVEGARGILASAHLPGTQLKFHFAIFAGLRDRHAESSFAGAEATGPRTLPPK